MKACVQCQRGFTLVELLIVVIILALLSAIVVPQFAASTDDAKSSAADTSLSNLRAAMDLYYQQHGEYPGANTAVPSKACGGTSGTGVATGGAGATAATAFLEQLSLYTDADGGACSKADANHKFGPYMKKPQLENEPFGSSNALEVVADADLNMSATAGDPGGYKYDSQTGKIIINIAAESGR
jgi:general secretion pathway protein G